MCSVVNGTAHPAMDHQIWCRSHLYKPHVLRITSTHRGRGKLFYLVIVSPEDRWSYCQRSFCVLAVTTVGGNDGNKSARPAGWLGARDS